MTVITGVSDLLFCPCYDYMVTDDFSIPCKHLYFLQVDTQPSQHLFLSPSTLKYYLYFYHVYLCFCEFNASSFSMCSPFRSMDLFLVHKDRKIFAVCILLSAMKVARIENKVGDLVIFLNFPI